MSIVRVRESCVVHLDGAPFVLRKDQPYDSDDHVVREFPGMFTSDDEVEQATAAPGEKRNVRRKP